MEAPSHSLKQGPGQAESGTNASFQENPTGALCATATICTTSRRTNLTRRHEPSVAPSGSFDLLKVTGKLDP